MIGRLADEEVAERGDDGDVDRGAEEETDWAALAMCASSRIADALLE